MCDRHVPCCLARWAKPNLHGRFRNAETCMAGRRLAWQAETNQLRMSFGNVHLILCRQIPGRKGLNASITSCMAALLSVSFFTSHGTQCPSLRNNMSCMAAASPSSSDTKAGSANSLLCLGSIIQDGCPGSSRLTPDRICC